MVGLAHKRDHWVKTCRVFKNTEFYGGGKTSENSLNEPAELSLRCLAKTENDHVCRCLATLALEMWVSLLEG